MTISTKRIFPNKGKTTPIAFNSPVVIENELPLSTVYYPNHYGIFFAFSESNDSEIYLCSCNIDLIKNYEKIRQSSSDNSYANKLDNAKYSSKQFPEIIAENSLNKEYQIQFKNKICHRCNLKTPTLRYCHEMYGGKFKQHYGWYINQVQLRFSFFKYSHKDINYLPKEISPYILEFNNLHKERTSYLSNSFDGQKPLKCIEIEKSLSKLERKIDNYFENITREEFDFRKIGEGNVSELLMAKLIQQIYPEENMIMHYRPKWLEGLELDVFLPGINLGFEYQGQQHFYSIKAWGGDSALKKVRERDKRKKELCKINNVNLVEIDFTEPLEQLYIKEKITKHFI